MLEVSVLLLAAGAELVADGASAANTATLLINANPSKAVTILFIWNILVFVKCFVCRPTEKHIFHEQVRLFLGN